MSPVAFAGMGFMVSETFAKMCSKWFIQDVSNNISSEG